MEHHLHIINRFYQAFQQKDPQGMALCYHPDVTFEDPAFHRLHGWKAAAMWRMLCERGKGLEIRFSGVEANGDKGKAQWEADYTFSMTGRKVKNKVEAEFRFKDGLIIEHTDRFDMRKWMGMALGFKGQILGLLPPAKSAFQKKARAGLEQYIQKNSLTPDSFILGTPIQAD